MPGSREQEVEKMLSLMLSVRDYFKNYQFVIAGAPSLPKEFYQKFVDDDVHFVSNKTYDLLRCSKAALVTSERQLWKQHCSMFQKLCVIEPVLFLTKSGNVW